MLYLYKPLIYKKLKGELGWGRRDTEEGVYPLLEGVEANHCALIAPLSAKNDVARFLIDHGLKPQCTELLFSPQTAVDPTFSPVVVFGLASRLPSGDSRFVKDVGSIDDDPVDFYDFEKLYRHCCTKIATLKEDFSPVDIFVDTTAGTAVVSMACLHAAMHEGVNAIYVKGTMPNPKAGGPPLVVADNPKSGSIILVHNVRTETVS
jgi:hypothetical protein